MNNEFLNCLLSDKEELKKCSKWLSSQKDEVGDHGFRKTDFVIFFLTYLRLQTARLFKQKQGERKPDWKIATPVTDTQTLVVKPLSTGDTVRRLFSPEHENLPPNGVLLSPVKHRPNITDERQYGNFQNSRTPQKLFNPQSGNWELVNAIHHNPTWSQSNNFQMNQQNNPFSPPNHYQGGQRNYAQGVGQAAYHTPRRTNYRNSLVFSNSSSSSGILSPESPKMPGDFRKFGGGDRRGPTPKNPCIGDFIVGATRKQERGGRKRIKPTRLPTSSDSQISDTSNVSNPINDLFTRVPESSSASSNLSDRATNYDEERKLLKQYNSEKEGNSNLQHIKMTKKVNDSPNKKQQERKKKGVDIKSPAIKVKPKEDVCSESRTETENLRATSTGKKENVAMTSPEPIFIRPDPSKVIKPLVLEDLAEIYCVLLDYNLVFNVTTEIHFVISLLAVNVAVKESDKHPNSDKSDENSPKKEQSVNVVCEENILGVDKLESSASPPSPTPISSPPSFSPTSHPPTSPPLTSLPITANELNKDVKDLLNDVHSSVYFACVVLEKQIKFFQLLDRSTLKLLSENWKIELFAPRLRGKLVELYSLQRSTAPKPSASTPKGPELGICPVQFHAESDNRSTFSSDNSFATFRKQRDELYNILQAWNKSQQQQVDGGSGESGVTFTKVKGRVDRLLAMSQDPINVRHLAKHFCDLLLKAVSTCEENTIEELENLPDVNKSKLTLLTKRLTEPSSEKIASPRPETSFPGFQQFYHDFLVMASQNFLFNVHLINCFVKEITARSSATYDIDESDGEGQVVQEETRQMFVHGLSSLCVLAKFLGLVVFAPYRSSSEISKSVLQEEINIRKQLEPPLKLETHLNEAAKRGSLVYTVPWIVEYLGMMDTVAPHLPHYQNVLVTLFNVYLLCVPKWSLELPQSASKEEKSTTTDETGETFVSDGEKLLSNNEELVSKEEKLVSKGEIVENLVPNIDKLVSKDGKLVSKDEKLVSKGEIVENLVPNIDKLVSKDGKLVSNDKKLMSSDEKLVSKVVIDGNLVSNDENCRKVIKLAPFVCSLLRLCLGWLFDSENFPQEVMVKVALHSDVEQFLEEKFQTTRNKLTMDNSSDLVTREMIHKFCPYLKSFHGLLARKDTANGVVTVRHVTPISKGGSSLTPPAASCSLVPPEIALQLQLEDHFFMGQSESVQRTVEFVAERIASACIKEVIGTVVVGLKKKVTDIMELESTEPKKVDIQPLVSEYKTSVMKQLAIVKEERLGVALKALLGPDISSQSLDLCQQITARKFQERVINWLQTHINIEEILSKMLTNYENEHKNSNNNNDDDDALEDFFKVEKFDQNSTDAVDSASKTFSVDEITVCSKTLIHIQDISSDALESFGKQGMKTADEALELVSTVEKGLKKCPSNPIKKQICTALLDYVILMISFRPEQVTDAVIGQLASVVSEISEVMHLWSQRNVMLLFQGQPSTYAAVWKRFSRLTVALVEKNAMDICSLEQQVVSLFRCSWPDNVLQTISEGIQCTVTDLKMNSLCDAEFLDLLSNIAVDIKADEYD